MKTLIYGSSYLDTPFKVDLAKLWYRLVRHLNPDTDLIAIDSNSPFKPEVFLPGVEVFQFGDNIGSLSKGERDGPGRAFVKGMETAIEREYDFCVHWELDVLFAVSIDKVVRRMTDAVVEAAAMLALPYAFCEFGISFFNVEYLQESKFIERYDWQNAPAWPIPEVRIEQLLGDNLFLLPYRGRRNEDNMLNVPNLANHFPYFNCAWLHHIGDLNLAYRFLELNGINLP